jgi:hypothetical protein
MGSVFFQQLGVRPDPHEAEEPGDHADSVIDLRSTSETWEWLFGLVAVGALAITLSAAPPAVHDRWASIGDQIEAAIGANVDIVVFGVAAAVVAYLAWVGICKGLDWLAMSRERRQLSKEYPHG